MKFFIFILVALFINLILLYYIHNDTKKLYVHKIVDKESFSNEKNTCILKIDNKEKIFDSSIFSNNEENICYTDTKNIDNNVKCCPSTIYVNDKVVCRKDFNNMTMKDIENWENECFPNNINNTKIYNATDTIYFKENLIESLNKKILSLNSDNTINKKNNDNHIKEKIELENQILILKKELEDYKESVNKLESVAVAFTDDINGYKKYSDSKLSSSNKYLINTDKNIDVPQDCSEICDKNNSCQSFTYDNVNQVCKFYNINSDTVPLHMYGKNIGNIDYYEKIDPIYNYKKYTSKTLNNKTKEIVKSDYPVDCSILCDKRDWCSSFEYNKIKRECHLKDKSYDDKNPLVTNSSYDYYNIIKKNDVDSLDKNLNAYWKLNEGYGNIIYDMSGNSIHGEVIYGTYTKDKKLNLIDFDGKKTIIILPGNKALDVKKISISIWIKPDDLERNGYIFEKTTNSYVNTQYSIFMADDNLVWRTNPHSDSIVTDWSKEDLSVPIKDNITPDTWCNIVVTHNGIEKKIYINGNMIKKMPYAKKLRMSENGISIIGAHGKPFNMYYKGYIRDIRVYKKDLTDEEIKKINSLG